MPGLEKNRELCARNSRMRYAQCRQDCVLPRMSTDISSPEAKAESLEASGNMNRVWVESGLFLYRRGLITRCPFHTYTASVCGLASFPRKRESFPGYPLSPGHPAPSMTCRDGLSTLPGHG